MSTLRRKGSWKEGTEEEEDAEEAEEEVGKLERSVHASYSMIRARRMNMSGSSNTKIMDHLKADRLGEIRQKDSDNRRQLPHSSMLLSKNSLSIAKMIQDASMKLTHSN